VSANINRVISKELALDDHEVPRRFAFVMIPYRCRATDVVLCTLHEYSVYTLDFVLRTSYSVHK
jgi:hypothetical protein